MRYRFCPKCGGKLEVRSVENKNSNQKVCQNCDLVFYQNPKPTASVLVVDGNRVLLGKRNRKPSKGMWDVPGGFLENNEHPEEAAKREAKEELGVEVELGKMLGIFMDTYGAGGDSTLNICYLARITKGQPKPADDVCELRWFEADKLPLKMAFKNGQKMLEAWKKSLE